MMEREKEERCSTELMDAILERPKGFSVKNKQFFLYQPSLGMTIFSRPILESLEIDFRLLSVNPYAQLMHVATRKKRECCNYIACNTIQSREQLFDGVTIEKRSNYFYRNLNTTEIATIITLMFSDVQLEDYREYLGINEDSKRYQKVLDAKDNKGSFVFFGKSIYGTLIDKACERYGWTFQYVVWGISYINLRLLFADSIKSEYLTEDERKKAHVAQPEETINMDDPNAWERIKNLHWD